MENKEEILRAINIAIKGYEYAIGKEYFDLYSARIHVGVCAYLIENRVPSPVVAKINEIGREFLELNYSIFKTEYKKCFKGFNKSIPYWSSIIPCVAPDEEQMNQSLQLRLRILKAIKIQLESLYFS